MCCTRYFTTLGAFLAGLAVAAGAFGAHGLDTYFAEKYRDAGSKTVAGVETPASEKYLNDFKTGVSYHMWHALGLIAAGLLAANRPRKSLVVAGFAFFCGIVLFSGTLYVLTIGGPRWLGVPWGAVAPIGGTLFIVGWAALAIGACPCRSAGAPDRLHELR